jgi:lipopolysaccharide transport system ATP-binding protein
MSNTVIWVENLSKQYRLGMVGAGTLREDVIGMWHRMRGKEDPYLKIGDSNDRSKAGSSDYVWALRDVNFEVQQGEVLGIIGKNGAGKSTLLKLLSRVTAPTTGSIKAKGRIASLLEVGTGFHPELTGRENIFLNGAIMGMKRAEIKQKFDEIVDFAGVQRYIDTPVKRYSSGMYVRLAFAVAAHLEPEILIVDEVLAVGDAEFQKKAIGKMQDVSSGQGRTVLFVSHNMTSIQALCNRGIVLNNGTVSFTGDIHSAVDHYLLTTDKTDFNDLKKFEKYGVRVQNISIVSSNHAENKLAPRSPFSILVNLNLNEAQTKFDVNFALYNEKNIKVSQFGTKYHSFDENRKRGKLELEFKISDNPLAPGSYYLNFAISNEHGTFLHVSNIIYFDVVPEAFSKEDKYPKLGESIIMLQTELVERSN